MPVKRAAVARHYLAEAEDRRPGVAEDAFQSRAACRQRERAKIIATVLQHVERDEGYPPGGGSAVRLREMDASLQLLETDRLTILPSATISPSSTTAPLSFSA